MMVAKDWSGFVRGTGSGVTRGEQAVGTAAIKENFIALVWPQDVDNKASGVHLFSMENGMLHEYLVGGTTGETFSLVKCE